MKWKHGLGLQGKALREAIRSGGEDLESCKKTMSALLDCYNNIRLMLPDEEFFDFEEEKDSVEELIEIFDLSDDFMEDALLDLGLSGWNLPLQAVNESLRIFYDLCDAHGIWIGI